MLLVPVFTTSKVIYTEITREDRAQKILSGAKFIEQLRELSKKDRAKNLENKKLAEFSKKDRMAIKKLLVLRSREKRYYRYLREMGIGELKEFVSDYYDMDYVFVHKVVKADMSSIIADIKAKARKAERKLAQYEPMWNSVN